MDALDIRPMGRADVPAVTAFLAAVESVDQLGEHYSQDDLVEEIANPAIDLATDWRVAWDKDAVVGHWRLFPRGLDQGEFRVILDGAVRPDRRGEGIGSTLVAQMLARAAAYAAERSPEARLVATVTGPSEDRQQAELLADHGLRPDRWTFQMGVDLHTWGELPVELAEGYTITAWSPEVDGELRAAHNSAFLDHPEFTPWDEATWHQWVSGARSFRPAYTFLARDQDGAVTAYVQSAVYDATYDATGLHEGHIGRVGTVRAHRGRGLATALLRHTMAAYRAEGLDRAALHVDSENPSGALGVYQRAGFSVEKRLTDYRLTQAAAGAEGALGEFSMRR